jgi:hypothetical protein
VLCDIALPDGNGYDVIVEAKRKGSGESRSDIWLWQRVTISSAAEKLDSIHLAKPVDFHELRSVFGPDRGLNLMLRIFSTTGFALTLSN